jgi:chromosome condensin MukBEF ATPase and DNA-binding subunit MukB
MFQSLRQNNQIFILHKDKPLLEVGSVVSVSMPTPKYPVPPVFGQPQEMVVDIVVKINNQDVTYQKLPANLEIADFGTSGIVVSDNKLAMNSEIMSLKQKSIDAINNVNFHQQVVAACDKMLSDLNPEFAEKQQQQAEINELKSQVGDLTREISSLMQMNRDLIAQLKQNKED